MNKYDMSLWCALFLMALGIIFLFYNRRLAQILIGTGVVIGVMSQHFEHKAKEREYLTKLMTENIKLKKKLREMK